MADSGGVFSFTSFDMRIVRTWPEAWEWILHNEVFPFGVGLGGIGGAQRFYAANFFNPSDNLFIFLYANFGLMGIVYLAWTSSMWLGLPRENRRGDCAACCSGLQSRLRGRTVNARGSDIGVVHRGSDRNVLAITPDDGLQALE